MGVGSIPSLPALVNMPETRTLEGWVKKSFAIPGKEDNFLLTYNLQSIGRLDRDLSSEWSSMKDNLTDPENIERFSQHAFLSSLWVMGTYEFVRVMKKLDPRPETKLVYELFRRVRVPMVKFEPAQRVKGQSDYPGDFSIAQAAIGKNSKDLGWSVGPSAFISREQLAEELYKLY